MKRGRVELSDVLIPLVYGDPATLADGLGRSEKRRERLDRSIGVILGIGLGVVLGLLLGCSAKLGPGEHGWASWDVCGFAGGVAAELQVLAMSTRLGCTNPEPELEPEPEPNP